MTGREISLSYEDKLEWITKEDSTILRLVFLPLPETGRATSPQSAVDMFDTGQLLGNEDTGGIKESKPPITQQQLQDQTQPPSQNGELTQKSWGNKSQHGQIPLRATKYL